MTVQLPLPPDMIAGPPGTGKTTELTKIFVREAAGGVSTQKIGLFTFTKEGARVARERVRDALGLLEGHEDEDLVNIRTLHSMARRELRMDSKLLVDERGRLREFSAHIGKPMSSRSSRNPDLSENYTEADRMYQLDHLARVRMVTLEEQYSPRERLPDLDLCRWFSESYRQWKDQAGLHDYTDMIETYAREGRNTLGLEVLLIDEAQDLTRLQWEVVAILAREVRLLVIAFDDDQAIYQWAGADVEIVQGLVYRSYTVLEHSHRVPQAVHEYADQVIGRVPRRMPKQWRPRAERGSVQHLYSSDHLTSEYWGDGSVLVLGRNDKMLRRVRGLLQERGIFYQDKPRRGAQNLSVDPSLYEDIRTWTRLRRGETVTVAEAQHVYRNRMTSGVGIRNKDITHAETGARLSNYVSMSTLRECHGLLTDAEWWEAFDRVPPEQSSYIRRCLQNRARLDRTPLVRLSTIHGSKGGEADRVILFTGMSTLTWKQYFVIGDSDSEHRNFYVGMTRARSELVIVHEGKRQYHLGPMSLR